MNGIDVSGWQPANITGIVDYDFAIIKATEGVGYISPFWRTQTDIARTRGKKVGLYHFASGVDPIAEADFFLNVVKDYVGVAVLVLDWEASAIGRGREWVRSFVKRIKEKTKVPPIIYGSASPMDAHNIPELAAEENCGLWVAAYPTQNTSGYRDEPQLHNSVIRQYTSKGRLGGYAGNLDLNRSIITPEQWDKYALGQRDSYIPPEVKTRLSNEQLADLVLAGKYGDGEARRSKLTSEGYNYSDVQAVVNMKLGVKPVPQQKPDDIIANEVLGGLWGNGDQRKQLLEAKGYNYDNIQNLVNLKLKVDLPVKSSEEYFTVPSGVAGYLGNVAARFGTTVNKIVEMNKGKYPSMTANYVQAGWIIRVK